MTDNTHTPIAEDTKGKAAPLSTRLLIIHAVLITLIVVGSIMRVQFVFIHNPLETLFSDPLRHYNQGFDVKGNDLECVLNPPGMELFTQTVLRITGPNRFALSCVMAILSLLTPLLWYRWLRELTLDKTISLFGYAIFTYLDSYFRIFGWFMDSVVLLPLTGAALWLTWRAARKGTWQSCLLAACICGAACATKAMAIPIVSLPWLYVLYRHLQWLPKQRAVKMFAASALIVVAFCGLAPLKVYTHIGAFVLLPQTAYTRRYFESGAKTITVTSWWFPATGGEFATCCGWGSPSLSVPPFYPFSNWQTDRQGEYQMMLDYRKGFDYVEPIKVRWQDRLRYTRDNIIYLFFGIQWPEDTDWMDPFPLNLPIMQRFIWLPLTIFLFAVVLIKRKREFMGWYFIAVTLIFMFQQSAIMEGRYKKIWEGVALGTFFSLVARSKRYQSLRCGINPAAPQKGITVTINQPETKPQLPPAGSESPAKDKPQATDTGG